MSKSTTRAEQTWRGSSRQERDAQRRDRLIQAGLETFGTSGYQTSTVSGLCALAGVSTRSFYELFPHRSDLLLAVYLQICNEIIQGVSTLDPPRAGDLHAWLRRAVEAVVGPLLADLRKIRVIEIEMVGVSARLEEHRRSTTRDITDALGAWQEAVTGEVDATRRILISTFVEGGMSEALVSYARGELTTPLSAAQFIDEVSTLIERLLLP